MGTPFTSGQLSKLQNVTNIGVTTALPNVATKFDPKTILKSLDGKGEIFAGYLETALEQALNKMLVLAPRGTTTITLTERHNPDSFYQTRSGLYVYDGFRNLVVAKAKPVEAGTVFKLDHSLLIRNLKNEQIEKSLPKKHLFDESVTCAIIATMIKEQPNGKEGELLNNGYANLFYTSSCVVLVRWDAVYAEWDVNAWERGGDEWGAGLRVFSPATGT